MPQEIIKRKVTPLCRRHTYWESYGKQAVNPLTGEAVVADRRRIKIDYELPMRDEYTRFVLALLDSAAKERDK